MFGEAIKQKLFFHSFPCLDKKISVAIFCSNFQLIESPADQIETGENGQIKNWLIFLHLCAGLWAGLGLFRPEF